MPLPRCVDGVVSRVVFRTLPLRAKQMKGIAHNDVSEDAARLKRVRSDSVGLQENFRFETCHADAVLRMAGARESQEREREREVKTPLRWISDLAR